MGFDGVRARTVALGGIVSSSSRAGLLLGVLPALTACAMTVSHAKDPAGARSRDEGQPRRVALVAKSLWRSTNAADAEDDPDLLRLLRRELDRSGNFVRCPPGEEDLRLEVLFRDDAADAGNMEGVGMISTLTLWVIPEWYSRALITEVTATSRDGVTRTFTESDSYTKFLWLPAMPLALFWTSSRAFDDVARSQFGRVLEQL